MVQTDGGTSYLFGTMHAGFEIKELPEFVLDTLDASGTFIMEADITTISPTAVFQMGLLGEGDSLDVLVGDELWPTLVEIAKKIGVPDTVLSRFEPWLAYMFVIQSFYPPGVAIDLSLMERAEAGDKKLVFLEDWKFQMDVLATSFHIEDLREVLEDLPEAKAELAKMTHAYRSGDFAKITEITMNPEEIAKAPERHKALFSDRNHAWIKILKPILDRGGAFIAVGVGHFAGDEGLLALLKAEGYSITRVSSSTSVKTSSTSASGK